MKANDWIVVRLHAEELAQYANIVYWMESGSAGDSDEVYALAKTRKEYAHDEFAKIAAAMGYRITPLDTAAEVAEAEFHNHPEICSITGDGENGND